MYDNFIQSGNKFNLNVHVKVRVLMKFMWKSCVIWMCMQKSPFWRKLFTQTENRYNSYNSVIIQVLYNIYCLKYPFPVIKNCKFATAKSGHESQAITC